VATWKKKDYDVVVNWASPVIEDHAQKLKTQEVDGPAIIEMETMTKQELAIKFNSHPYNMPDGPATKLAAAIKALRGPTIEVPQQGIKRAGTHEDEPQAKKNKLGTTTCVN